MQQVRVTEVAILRDDNATFLVRKLSEPLVGGVVTVRQLGGVQHVVTGAAQLSGESLRQLRVDQESHAVLSGTTRPRPAASAPNSRAARRSSRSRSG